MDMINTHAGKLRAIGYDARRRVLRVTLEDGTHLEYANVGESLWRNFKQSGAQWSYYRDHIEEAFSARLVSDNPASASGGKNPLDDLFG